MFQWYVPIVVCSATGYRCFNSALDVLPIPAPPGKYSGKERYRWRNAITSLFNSALMSVITLYCWFSHPQIWTDPMGDFPTLGGSRLRTMDLPGKSAALYRPRKSPIGYNSVVADAGLAVMSGYVLYDTYDILMYTDLSKVFALITHHVTVAVVIFMVSYETIGIGVLYIALLTEVHAIFLHSRQLLIMYGVSKSSTLYSVHKSINLVTFVVLRLVPLLFALYCFCTMINRNFFALYYILPCFSAVICTINFVLLWRLLRSDFLVTNGKDGNILED
ncbi:TLC domain-containing protein 2-like [Asterias rubens]|uniref:TLC domain-containing protein 2-like n=1 Tax=Asterias rubens TaxID=7604 RepID=UPI001455BE34|nr:TLC domain-containing protein 2-like [Asterias rubens]